MARLPMIEWPDELVERRIGFLRAAARFVPPNAEVDPRILNPREPERGPVSDIHALMAAVDLAFATDRTAAGLELLRDAVQAMIERNDLQMAALPGSVVGRVSTTLNPNEIHIVDRKGQRTLTERYPPPSPVALDLIADLVVASLLSEAPADRVDGFWGEWRLPVLRLNDPLLHAMAAFDPNDEWQVARDGVIANTVLWIERLRACRADRFHWERARVRTALIDFRRLVFEIALLRRPDAARFRRWHREHRGNGLAGAIDSFVSKLAAEIAARES